MFLRRLRLRNGCVHSIDDCNGVTGLEKEAGLRGVRRCLTKTEEAPGRLSISDAASAFRASHGQACQALLYLIPIVARDFKARLSERTRVLDENVFLLRGVAPVEE